MFALLMQQKRALRRVTLEGLAATLGLGPGGHAHLSKIERGLHLPSFPLALAIAQALDMDLEVFTP